jgi:hypothetical protein
VPAETDTLLLFMSNVAWTSGMNPKRNQDDLRAKDAQVNYRRLRLVQPHPPKPGRYLPAQQDGQLPHVLHALRGRRLRHGLPDEGPAVWRLR